MTRLRCISACFVSLLLVQLLLVESGFACRMQDMPLYQPGTTVAITGAMAGGDDMDGMDMDSMDMDSMDMSGMRPQQPSQDDGGKPDEAPCRFPWAPVGCQSMAPCGTTALVTASPALTLMESAPVAVLALTILTPPSETRAPELPPPRA